MPEFRQDLISGQWVVMATERAMRPERFARKGEREDDRSKLPAYDKSCPFCPGNEQMTPPAVLRIGREGTASGTGDWRVRVLPNKYPAVEPVGDPQPVPRRDEALYKDMPGYGIHEVLIETPEHNRHPGALEPRQMELVVHSYRQRFSALAGNSNLHFVYLFRNHGREAGASIEHPHSQLIALPFVPLTVQQEIENAHRFFLNQEACPYCVLLAEELCYTRRAVAGNDLFFAYIPYAARYPFEIWIVPRRHQSSFLELTEEEAIGFSDILTRVLGLLARALDDPPYNYYLHSAPLRTTGLPHYHWHLELVPRLTTAAGFEMGTGVFINVTLPEEAARFLRDKEENNSEFKGQDILCSRTAQSSTGR